MDTAPLADIEPRNHDLDYSGHIEYNTDSNCEKSHGDLLLQWCSKERIDLHRHYNSSTTKQITSNLVSEQCNRFSLFVHPHLNAYARAPTHIHIKTSINLLTMGYMVSCEYPVYLKRSAMSKMQKEE